MQQVAQPGRDGTSEPGLGGEQPAESTETVKSALLIQIFDSRGWQASCRSSCRRSTIECLGMTPYQIHGPARTCSRTGRELRPGEAVYSVLWERDGQLVRQDFAREAWSGAPAGAVAWWLGRVPVSGVRSRPVIQDDLLVECLDHLAGSDDVGRQRFRYVAALLLMRRKRFQFQDSDRSRRDVMVLRDVKTGRIYEIPDPHLTEEEMAAARDELFRVLGWDEGGEP